jgi:hypothetical protein
LVGAEKPFDHRNEECAKKASKVNLRRPISEVGVNTMINPVSSLSTPHPAAAAQSTWAAPATQQKTNAPQDTVHLSQAALAAAGDVDHDGDSH